MSPVWRDGHVADEDPGLRPDSAAWGAFTTVGCDRRRPYLWSRHRRRLETSIAVLGAEGAVTFPSEAELCDLLTACDLGGPARLRVVIQRIAPFEWRVEASVTAVEAAGPEQMPAKLTVERWPSAPPLAGHKTLARLAWDLARERARDAGCEDALLVDAEGRVLETSIANVFVIREGVARTPAAPPFCLPGVMRGWLLEHLDHAGISTESGEVGLDVLERADEVWLSNAVAGVRRVERVGEIRWQSWPVFERLRDLGVPAPGWEGSLSARPDGGGGRQ